MTGRELLFTLILVTFVVGQHFQVGVLFGYAANLGLLCGLVVWVSCLNKSSQLWNAPTILLPPAIALMAALISPINYSQIEFLKTFALLSLACLIMSTARSPIKTEFIAGRSAKLALLISLFCVSTLSVLQVIGGTLGSDAFFNPWGSRQFLREYDPLMQFSTVPRAHGFFLEPSYNAFILVTTTLTLLALKHRPVAVTLLFFAGIIATQSASGLLLGGVIVLAALRRSRPGALVGTLGLSVAGAWLVGPYLLERLQSANQLGSSTNYRIVAPLEVLRDTLLAAPLGYPLGSTEQVLSSYNLLLGSQQGTSLDNGAYVLTYYFGWFGLVGLLLAAMFAMARTISDRTSSPAVSAVPVIVVGSLLFSGAVLSPEYVIMIWLLIQAYRHHQSLATSPEVEAESSHAAAS